MRELTAFGFTDSLAREIEVCAEPNHSIPREYIMT